MILDKFQAKHAYGHVSAQLGVRDGLRVFQRILPLLQGAQNRPQAQGAQNKLKQAKGRYPEGPERRTLLGYEIALIMLVSLICLWVSYRAFNEAWKPSTSAPKLGYFITAWLFGSAGLIGILLALAA